MQTLKVLTAISVWNMNKKFVEFLIQAEDQVKVNPILTSRGLQSSIIIHDVQRTLDDLKPTPLVWNENALRNGYRLNWDSYPTLPVIDEYLMHLVKKFPHLCNLTTIGHSVEKRPIKMLRISNGNQKNKAILMTAGLHAREWIAITSALYLIDKIVTNYDELPNYMSSIDWSIIPVLNPDGYEYTYTKDRLWRKNRHKTNKHKCMGVDLNRNFDYDWYVSGLQANSCRDFEIYSGPHPFSEPETQAIRNLIQTSKKLPEAFIDVHTYGQLIMYPWGSKPYAPRNEKVLEATGTAMSQAIFRTTTKNYTVGSIYHTVYQTSGTQIDWFLSLGVKYSFIFELRDERTSGRGFLLPPESIKPTGTDLVAAMDQLAKTIAEPTYKQTAKNKNNHKLWIFVSGNK